MTLDNLADNVLNIFLIVFASFVSLGLLGLVTWGGVALCLELSRMLSAS